MYKALLVDDEYMILEGLKKIIVWESFHITIVGTAKNGLEALEFVEHHAVDIVITDVTMPLLSGIDFVYEAIKRGFNFKFIVLSGYQEFEFAQKSIQLGAANYLLKPINKKELEDSLTKITTELKDEKGYDQTNQFVFRQLLYQWLQGENVIDELQDKLKYQLEGLNGEEFTVVFMQLSKVIDLEEWERYAEKRKFYFTVRPGMKDLYLIIRTTDCQSIKAEINYLIDKINDEAIFFIGLPAFNQYEVAKSFNSIKEMKASATFYQQVQKINWCTNKERKREIIEQQAGIVNKSILSRDVSRIIGDLKKYSNSLEEHQILPEVARWQSYIILINGYLVFGSLNNVNFKETAKEIFSVPDFDQLKKLIEEKILPVHALSNQLMYSELIKQAVSVIQKNYQQDLKLKKVATDLHINAMYLGQVFKKETGKSFSHYLNEYRIDLAKELLIQSNEPISDIAYHVGYQNQGYFYKIFKQHINYSPREYREQIRKEIKIHFTLEE